MISKLEKAIYSRYICYLPVVAMTLFISSWLFYFTPGKCFLNLAAQECFFSDRSYNFIYHPLNICNIIFITYSLLYLYYNIILKRHVVGRAVKKIYGKVNRQHHISNKRQKISILLFCYVTALSLSYFRFAMTIARAI